MIIQGKAITFGNNIDTDQIIGAQHLSLPSIGDMAPHTLANHAHFITYFAEGDILVGGDNFGCGSSREQAPAVLKERGVAAIVARSFARIFFRNAINLGLPVLICPEAGDIALLDRLEIGENRLRNLSTGRQYPIEPLSPFVRKIVDCSGIIPYLTSIAGPD